tara:strand:- start:94 stop:459 length:366 start_codon:yes stop_codon:yes gene_type:complete
VVVQLVGGMLQLEVMQNIHNQMEGDLELVVDKIKVVQEVSHHYLEMEHQVKDLVVVLRLRELHQLYTLRVVVAVLVLQLIMQMEQALLQAPQTGYQAVVEVEEICKLLLVIQLPQQLVLEK